MEPHAEGQSSKFPKEVIILTALIVVIVLAVLVLQTTGRSAKQNFTSENVKVTKVDPTKATGKDKLPQGFPEDIPVNYSGVYESTTLTYPDRQVVLYSVSYYSAKQSEELYAEYEKYLAGAKYSIVNKSKSAAQMTYQASRVNDTLSVVITPRSPGAMIQLAFVDKQ